MKKKYNIPFVHMHSVRISDVIITSDPQITDDPTDGGSQLSKKRNDYSSWDNY